MKKTIPVNDTSFDDNVIRAGRPVLVDFWATWCGPCKQIAPILDQIATEQEGKLTIAKVDVDESQETAQKFGVMSIPTLILFKDGKEADRFVGFMPKDTLLKKLQPHLAPPA